MSRIELSAGIADDLDRIFDYLARYEADAIAARIGEIIQAIAVLEHNPLIGRPAPGDERELIIGRRSRGCVASYRYVAQIDTVFVLALRGQREAGYTRT